MTSFLRTRKDRHPKHDKPRQPQEQAPNAIRQDQEIRRASNDSLTGAEDMGKAPGHAMAGAPGKEPDES